MSGGGEDEGVYPSSSGTSDGDLRGGSVYALRSCGNVDAEGYLRVQYHPHQDRSLGVGDTTPSDTLVGAGVGRPLSPRRRSLGE